jgi:hypothetical protein
MSESLWLCDYDMVAEPASRRVTFYRSRKRIIASALKQDPALRVVHSSLSVIITTSRPLANTIAQIAKAFGARASHVYQIGSFELMEE